MRRYLAAFPPVEYTVSAPGVGLVLSREAALHVWKHASPDLTRARIKAEAAARRPDALKRQFPVLRHLSDAACGALAATMSAVRRRGPARARCADPPARTWPGG
jgi:hypothetical protein